MIITLVTDQFYQNNHGTSVSAQRVYNGLVERGHIVRVLAIDKDGKSAYALKERYFGKTITKIINSQGFQFAKPNRETMESAIKGSDIVHIYMPFKLGYKAIELCRQLNVPCTAAFHIVPENITSTIYMEDFGLLNSSFWRTWYSTTYRYVQHIHCPSLMVARQLQKHGYNADLHVISNGYNCIFQRREEEKPVLFKDKFVIAFVGRFSREKRYDLIIKAVENSKYKDKIQLVFGGKGPVKSQIMKMAKKLPNYPVFSFFTREQLISLFNFADLYIHPADIEVEGMSCLEATACGCVPVVSDSCKSATSQFATRKESIFKNGDFEDLASKIDWWIEHPKTLKAEREKVATHAEKFKLERSIDFYIDMFNAAIADWNKEYDGKDKKIARPPRIINNYE